MDNSLTEDRDCDERDNFILSVEDVNEREQNLDRDDFDQPDQLDASRTFELRMWTRGPILFF